MMRDSCSNFDLYFQNRSLILSSIAKMIKSNVHLIPSHTKSGEPVSLNGFSTRQNITLTNCGEDKEKDEKFWSQG